MKGARLAFAALACAALLASPAAQARGEMVAPKQGCAVEGVRVFVYDQGDQSTIEISTKLSAIGGQKASCTVDWSRVALGSPGGAAATPTVAIVEPFVDHALTPPIMLADGLSSAIVPAWKGDVDEHGKVVAVRLIVEGTAMGVRVEIPRDVFPRATANGARLERRVKGAREGTAKFGALGDLAITATGPGPADAFGPTGPLGEETTVVEAVPGGAPPSQSLPASIAVLSMLRATLPLRVVDLSPDNVAGWDEAARYAYAAALNGDPLIASLGAHTLAWLASGLSMQAVKVATTSTDPDTAIVPASVATAIGDPDARVQKTLGGIGRFMPLGRPSTFRKARLAGAVPDPARVKAAQDAVARLDGVKIEELVKLAVPALLDRTAPVDPPAPQPTPGAPPVASAKLEEPEEPTPVAPIARVVGKARHHARAKKRAPIGLFFGLLAAAGAIALALREAGGAREA
jgi:hypothetical protein